MSEVLRRLKNGESIADALCGSEFSSFKYQKTEHYSKRKVYKVYSTSSDKELEELRIRFNLDHKNINGHYLTRKQLIYTRLQCKIKEVLRVKNNGIEGKWLINLKEFLVKDLYDYGRERNEEILGYDIDMSPLLPTKWDFPPKWSNGVRDDPNLHPEDDICIGIRDNPNAPKSKKYIEMMNNKNH